MKKQNKNNKRNSERLAIIGAGNIGLALAKGFTKLHRFSPDRIILTRRRTHIIESYAQEGYVVQSDNRDAVRRSDIIIAAVPPQEMTGLLNEIGSVLDEKRHVLISVVSGVCTDEIMKHLGKKIQIVRVMPNLAVSIHESMTCIASNHASQEALDITQELFDLVGGTYIIPEELMIAATALCACGIAFFLRSIRAASQGGIEIGFHADEALFMAAQTAKGAAALLLQSARHPESEIDRVTTPRGCTIAGLNFMEHMGFSSALIKGIVTSAEKAAKLYEENNKE